MVQVENSVLEMLYGDEILFMTIKDVIYWNKKARTYLTSNSPNLVL